MDANFDAPGNDNKNPNGEWVKIRNAGNAAADLTGWRLQDQGPRHTYDFPNGFDLNPGATVQVFSGCGTDTATELYWCTGAVWNNRGDTAYLYDSEGTLVDSWSGP